MDFDTKKHLMDFVPFFMTSSLGGGKLQINLTRIAEAIIIAVLTAVIMKAYVAPEITALKESIQEIKQEVRDVKADIYRPTFRGDR